MGNRYFRRYGCLLLCVRRDLVNLSNRIVYRSIHLFVFRGMRSTCIAEPDVYRLVCCFFLCIIVYMMDTNVNRDHLSFDLTVVPCRLTNLIQIYP